MGFVRWEIRYEEQNGRIETWWYVYVAQTADKGVTGLHPEREPRLHRHNALLEGVIWRITVFESRVSQRFGGGAFAPLTNNANAYIVQETANSADESQGKIRNNRCRHPEQA